MALPPGFIQLTAYGAGAQPLLISAYAIQVVRRNTTTPSTLVSTALGNFSVTETMDVVNALMTAAMSGPSLLTG